MDKAQRAFGTKLKRGSVPVGRLTNLNPPETTRADHNVTDHDSPDGVEQFIPGLTNGGEVTFEGNLIATNDSQMGLAAAAASGDPEEWTIEFPTTPILTISFEGYVNAFKVAEAPTDGTLKFSAKIKVTSLPIIGGDVSGGLTGLVLTDSGGALTLSPTFNNGKYEYFTTTDKATLTVKPTAADHTITVNGMLVPSAGTTGDIALNKSELNTITVRAWEAGMAPVTYTVKVYRS